MTYYDTVSYKNIQEARKLLLQAHELLLEALKHQNGASEMKDIYRSKLHKVASDVDRSREDLG